MKNYILDTNVLIHDPKSIYNFEENNVIIPLICIEELDNLKKKEGMVGYHARIIAREIASLSGNLSEGINLPNGGTLKIELNQNHSAGLPNGFDLNKNDTKIINITRNIAKESNIETILVSKDLYMQIKGNSLGIKVQDYQNDRVSIKNLYKGYREVFLSSEEINIACKEGLEISSELSSPELFSNIFPNEFLCVKSLDNCGHEVLLKFNGERIVPLEYSNLTAWGLSPKNREQKMAFELLMDPKVKFVSITGGAGSGKTILSTSVALQKVIEQGTYKKIIFVKPVVPAGEDIGFLPGTEEEKLKPWMGSFYDAIENLTKKHKFSTESFIKTFEEKGVIETKTFTYMRGRTLNDALVIVDEAQEITPHLAKLMLTRAGFSSKFVFLGDPSDNQIDNILVDSKSNGLVYTIEKMKEALIAGHVTLEQVERSQLAAVAEKYL